MAIQSLRGIRNNNPLNIRRSNVAWLGKVANPTDKEFEQFESMLLGIRAALVNIRTHIFRDRAVGIQTTVQAEIFRWAPPSENNSSAYVRQVCQLAIVKADDVLRPDDKSQLCRVCKAMAKVETGWTLDIQYFYNAWDLL